MVTVFDTSALVAALTRAHPRFAWADEQVQAAERPALCVHSLAECYAVMTAHPQLRYPPTQVRAVLDSLTQTWTVLPLLPADYFDAMTRCRDLGLQGGAIYDTLIAQAALRAGAVRLVTLNAKHFVRLGDDVQRLVVAPEG
ncbi:type II toxin-antitoxin system VapC family toxin [Deinococcus sp. Arct2-2]|nr:type II toxin-antitoxin system VapC family toxin [Deinococcus sp. Arct2-2]